MLVPFSALPILFVVPPAWPLPGLPRRPQLVDEHLWRLIVVALGASYQIESDPACAADPVADVHQQPVSKIRTREERLRLSGA